MALITPIKLPDIVSDAPSPIKMKELENTLAVFEEAGRKKDKTQITEWAVNRSVVVRSLFYTYLFSKYGHGCTIRATGYGDDIAMTLEIGSGPRSKQQLSHITDYLGQVKRCLRKHNLVVFPVRLIFAYGAHANLIVIRKKQKTLEVVEPHGASFHGRGGRDQSNIFAAYSDVAAIFNKGKRKADKYTLMQSPEVCPNLGFQALESYSAVKPTDAEGGYCSVWSMFTTELILMNPDVPTNDVLSAAIRLASSQPTRVNEYLLSVIRGYTTYVTRQVEQYFTLIFRLDQMNAIRLGERSPSREHKLQAQAYFGAFVYIKNYLDLNPGSTPKSLASAIASGKVGNELTPNGKIRAQKLLARMANSEFGRFSAPGHHTPKLIPSIIYKRRCPKGTRRAPNGKCVKDLTPTLKNMAKNRARTRKSPKPCSPGQERNPATGRCRKIKAAKSPATKKVKVMLKALSPVKQPTPPRNAQPLKPALKPCPPGKERNPETGRCRKIKNQTKKVRITCPPGCILDPTHN